MGIFDLSEVGAPIVVLMIMFVFALGTIVGSFLNVVVFRLGTGERIGRDRSRCFSCGTTLQWYDLVPIVSFMLLRGRCRYCGSRISWQYPVVELVTGLAFMLITMEMSQNFSAFGGQFPISGFQIISNDQFPNIFAIGAPFIYFATIFSLLLVISVYDFRHKIIPNQLVYLFILLALFGFLVIGNLDLLENWKLEIGNSVLAGLFFPRALAGLGAFTFFASLWFFSKGKWMGFGDAKLALGMGFLLGPRLTTVAVMLSFWIGAVVAVPIVLMRGGGMKTQIPFGPFLVAGTFIVWLWGEQVLFWYLSLVSYTQ